MIDLAKHYISKKIELLKTEIIEKSAETSGSLILFATNVVILMFFFILLNLGIAFLIGEMLNKTSYGFLIVASFYLLLALFIFAFKKYLKLFIINTIIKFIDNKKL